MKDIISSENNLKSFYYINYGMKIKSEIEIDEFILSSETLFDVEITIGSMPKDILALKNDGRKSCFSKNMAWFHIDNVASYYITNGNKIVVEPCDGYDIKLLKVYLMCSCLGFIMLQNDDVAIHGGVVELNNKAVIITGDRGAGKSSLTTGLRKRGYRFIADDVAAMSFSDKPRVNPGFPYQKLCDDMMDYMDYDRKKYESFDGGNKIKYIIPSHDNFCNEKLELSAICKLMVDDVDKVSIEELTGKEKIDLIIKNIYREEFIKYMGGISPVYFKRCLAIAKNIKAYKIIRPRCGFTVDEQINIIEKTFSGTENYMAV